VDEIIMPPGEVKIKAVGFMEALKIPVSMLKGIIRMKLQYF
jgi:hypothetical protein